MKSGQHGLISVMCFFSSRQREALYRFATGLVPLSVHEVKETKLQHLMAGGLATLYTFSKHQDLLADQANERMAASGFDSCISGVSIVHIRHNVRAGQRQGPSCAKLDLAITSLQYTIVHLVVLLQLISFVTRKVHTNQKPWFG